MCMYISARSMQSYVFANYGKYTGTHTCAHTDKSTKLIKIQMYV